MRFRLPSWVVVAAIAVSGLCAEAEPMRIVTVEWLPLGLHGDILDAMEEGLKASASSATIERANALGDASELEALLAKLSAAPPARIVGFGNRVCEEVAVKCPSVPLLAIVGGPQAWSKKTCARRAAATLVYVTEPEAGHVWEVAGRLLPKAESLAILYTEACEANAALAEALERDPLRGGRKVVRLTVPPGNCRTDSDFDKAFDALPKDNGLTLLYVPDDPNCSRFGSVICRFAAERHLVILGSEAIAGKGCSAALALDTEALAKEVGAWMRRCDGPPATMEVRHAPYRVVFDEAVLAAQGLKGKP